MLRFLEIRKADRIKSKLQLPVRELGLSKGNVFFEIILTPNIYGQQTYRESIPGVYSACVNAATLALIDAGIPLKEYVCSCTASLANNDIPMVDISYQEEVIGGPTLTVAALPVSGKIVLMEMSQRFHLDHLPKVLEKALQGCRDIRKILDDAVRLHVRGGLAVQRGVMLHAVK